MYIIFYCLEQKHHSNVDGKVLRSTIGESESEYLRKDPDRKKKNTNNGLLTGCEGHTGKYRTAVFVQPELARAVQKDQGTVFPSMARANPVNKPFITCLH